MANAFQQAVYNEDQKKKLMEIYKNQGAGAVTSAALGMMAGNQGTATGGAAQGTTAGAAGSVAGKPTAGAVPGGALAQSQKTKEALIAADEAAHRQGKSLSPEQAHAIIDANARTTTPYMAAIAAADQAAQTPKSVTGGSGYKAAGNDTGKIRIRPDGTQWVADADGVKHFYEKSPVDQYLHGPFKSSNGNIYDFDAATDEELWSHGYVRDKNGGVRIANDMDRIAYAAMNGASPQEIGEMYRRLQDGYSGGNSVPQNTQPYTTPQNTPQGGGNAVPRNTAPLPQNTTPQGGGYSGGGTVPQGSGNGSGNTGSYPSGGSGSTGNGGGTYPSGTVGYTPYQLALDQFDYGKAPEWTGTDYETQRDEALQNARSMRWNGSDYQNQRDALLQEAMKPYEGSPYDQQRDDALAQYGEAWQGSEYQPLRDAALQRAENMQWNYDPNADPVWQALQKQYRREGDRATRNALGQAASMTGGVPSSYAVTAASQAGDYYAAQLSDRLPQVYQDAYNRYLQEFQRQMGISDQYQGFDDREYSRWADQQGKNLDLADRYNQYGQQDYGQYMDRVNQQLSGADRMNGYDQTAYQRYLDQYGQELDAADRLNNYGATEYGRYQDRLGQWNTDRNFRYGLNRDAVADARYADETAYERAWNEENRNYSRSYQARRDAILDNRADREWAQQLKEYADSQNWKATEWQQYLREYSDQLSDKEREWVYQMSRDAENDRRYNQEYEYQRTRDAEADRRYNDQTAYERAVYDEDRAYQRQQDEQDRKYQQDVFNYNAEQDALDRQYQQDVFNYNRDQDAYQKYLDEYEMGQQETESGNREYDDAIAFLRTYGVVGGRYADILGVPPGTTWDDYWKQYGYDPSAQSDSGGYSGGGGNPPPQTEPPAGTKPVTDETPRISDQATAAETVPGVIHENGKPMTKGFQKYWQMFRDAFDQGASREEIIQGVESLIRQGLLADYEREVILRKLGILTRGGGGGR